MKQLLLALIATMLILPLGINATILANDELPTAEPEMEVEDETGPVVTTEYTGSAPLSAHFRANVQNQGDYTPLYEWRVYKDGNQSPYLIRYEADFDYEFRQSGSSKISLTISFVNQGDTIVYEMPTDFKIEVYTSVLNVPNAFSPNGDGANDIFRVKSDYKSIVDFHAYIFNRFGKKLYEWTNLDGGWDGTFHGSPVADGAYFVRIDAKGADGRHYNIKKAINLLRGYNYDSTFGE